MTPFEIGWESREFEYRPKDVSWYWVSIIIAVLLVAFSVWQRNFLFGVFILIAEILILVWGNRKPRSVACLLNEKGLAIGDEKVYIYEEIENFSAREDLGDAWAEVSLHFKKRLKPKFTVSVPKEKLEDVRKTLRMFLEEIPAESSLLDIFERFLRF